jgi:hypothetical protein
VLVLGDGDEKPADYGDAGVRFIPRPGCIELVEIADQMMLQYAR